MVKNILGVQVLAGFIIQILLLLSSSELMAQDEQLYKKIVGGEFKDQIEDLHKVPEKYGIKASSPYYQIQLDGQGPPEGLITEMIDTTIWLHLHDDHQKRVRSFQFIPDGIGAKITKVLLKQLSSDVSVLLVFFYEGAIDYVDFQGRQRLYLISFEKGDFKNAWFHTGAMTFQEKTLAKDYILREYEVFTKDYNRDGVKEVVVSYRYSSDVYHYLGQGKWSAPNFTVHPLDK